MFLLSHDIFDYSIFGISPTTQDLSVAEDLSKHTQSRSICLVFAIISQASAQHEHKIGTRDRADAEWSIFPPHGMSNEPEIWEDSTS